MNPDAPVAATQSTADPDASSPRRSTGDPAPRQRRGPAWAKWARILLPALLILGWLIAAGVGGPYFGRVSEVSSNDQSQYLPGSSDAAAVQELLPAFRDGDDIPAILVWTAADAIDEDARAQIDSALADIAGIPGIGEVSPAIPSDDGLAVQAFAPISPDVDLDDTVEAIRAALAASAPSGVAAHVTGPAGFSADLVEAFSGIDGLLLLVALAAVLVILVVVYRSPLLPFIVLSTSLFALCTALLVVWWLAKAEILLLSGQTQGILFILVIGAATDYSLLYVARYRETLQLFESKWDATWAALRGAWEPIVASGGTVIAGLLMLLFSDLKSNSGMGPVAAIGIVFAMLAALSLLPALLLWAGRAAFWPRRTQFDPAAADADAVRSTGLWARLGRRVQRAPRAVWVGTTIVLAVLALFTVQLKADGVPSSEFVLGESDARAGQQALGEHFPGGSGSPAQVIVDAATLLDDAAALERLDGVDSVSYASADSPSGSVPVVDGEAVAFGPPGTPPAAPTVVDDRALLQATLTDAPDSEEAQATIAAMRDMFDDRQTGERALVGGVTATALDANEASIHDRNLIIPLILAVITLILMLLLRSVLAPLLLIATVVLSFFTAMGVSALVFNHLLGLPGADPTVPLYGFVFLVALGIDYNIFLMTRVREESLVHGTREGVLRGLSITGGVITSAGLVLAATFAALSVLPILFLVQLAFIVAFGVLLDTFVVRTLLVPALATDIGRAIWWPSKLARGRA